MIERVIRLSIAAGRVFERNRNYAVLRANNQLNSAARAAKCADNLSGWSKAYANHLAVSSHWAVVSRKRANRLIKIASTVIRIHNNARN